MATKTKKKKGSKKGSKKKAPTKKPASKKGAAIKVGSNGTVDLGKGRTGIGLRTKGTKKTDAVAAMLPRSAVHIVKGFNPRSKIGDVEALSKNIKAEGLIHDILVRPAKGQPGHYNVVAGERRLRAMIALGWKDIPCKIRTDLEKDDLRALAIAVSENSEELDTHLNAIELGRVVQKFTKKGWSIQKIATDCGVHPQMARRCLALMKAPEDVQTKVALGLKEGGISLRAGLELAKLDDATRQQVKDALSENPTSAEIKRAAKKAATEAGASSKPGKTANKQKGQQRDAALITWQGSRAKQKTISYLANLMHTCDKDEVGTVDYHEIRGALGVLLWDRGDLEDFHLPSTDPKECSASEKKLLKKLESIVTAESAKHKPDADAEGDEDE